MAGTLVLIKQDHQQVKRTSLHAITLARQLGGEYALLMLGYELDKTVGSLVSLGANAVVVRITIGRTVSGPLRNSCCGSCAKTWCDDSPRYFCERTHAASLAAACRCTRGVRQLVTLGK